MPAIAVPEAETPVEAPERELVFAEDESAAVAEMAETAVEEKEPVEVVQPGAAIEEVEVEEAEEVEPVAPELEVEPVSEPRINTR